MSSSASDDVTRPIGDSVVSLPSDASADAPIVPPGGRIGRYAVLDEIGRGGMGVVLRAYDPKLQREVALKVVRAESTDTEARLNREARAMAQLNHPNVVAIYDVTIAQTPGHPQPQVVLAMEYVAGVTLRQWRAHERSTAEILDALVQAGRGLAAAHREGLLHRDFKPDNVLVGDDGRVRVTDFGLARVDSDRDSKSGVEAPTGEWSETCEDALTRVGTILGTPKYMAPEQHRAKPLTAAADQYAFCVTLWEALHDEAPFRGRTVEALMVEKLAGPPTWPRGAAVSSRVAEAVRRGLEPEPSDRFATMDELLAVLAPQPTSSWRARGLLLAAAGGTIVLAWAIARPGSTALCSGAEEQLASIWDATRRDAVQAAFLEGEVAFAPGVWERVAPQLDAWTSTWAEMHVDSCEATRVRGEQSEAVMDLRIACLHRARLELQAAVDVLADATPSAVENAHEVVAGLPPLERCADVEALQADVAPPEAADAGAVATIRADLAEATARRRAGEYEAALAAATRADTASAEIAYAPVRTEVLLELGSIHNTLGRYDEAEAELRQAQQLGATWKQWDAVREATVRLILVLGYEKARHDEALALRELALGLSAHAPRAEASARSNIGLVLLRMGRYDEAAAEHLAALELRRQSLGAEHPDVASSRNNVANVLIEQGKYAEAEAEYRAAIAVRSEALGLDHPDVAATRNNLGLVLQEQGRYDEAAEEHRAALAIRIQALGPDHPDVAASRNNLGLLLQLQGHYDEAEMEYRAALALWEKTLGPGHPHIARSRGNLGSALAASGRFAEAEVEYRAALAAQLEALAHDHPDVAATRHNLAIALKGQGRYAESEAEFRAALALRLATLGAEHPAVASTRNNLGNVLHEQGEDEDAELEHRAALEAWTRALGPEHPDVAASHGNLAAVLRDLGKYDEAEAEYRAALALREKVLPPNHPEIAEALHGLGTMVLLRGRRAEGLSLLERAWGMVENAEARPEKRGDLAFDLADALWKEPSERRRARTLAERAAEAYAEAGPSQAEALTEARAWLRAHP